MNSLCLSEYFNSTEEAWSFFEHALPEVISETARELQGVFCSDELETIVLAMRDVELVPHAAGNIVYHECIDLISFQWVTLRRTIDAHEFLRKISRLKSFQLLFLEIWAKHYWNKASNNSDFLIEYYVGTLEKVDKALSN